LEANTKNSGAAAPTLIDVEKNVEAGNNKNTKNTKKNKNKLTNNTESVKTNDPSMNIENSQVGGRRRSRKNRKNSRKNRKARKNY
jgi:hypothetical protein